MLNKEDYKNKPTEKEMSDYINNDLWNKFCIFMEKRYEIIPEIEFNHNNIEYGWSMNFKKDDKSLCVAYPREHYFCVMIIIDKDEKQLYEKILPTLSIDIQELDKETPEKEDKKYLMIELENEDKKYEDVKNLIEIKYN